MMLCRKVQGEGCEPDMVEEFSYLSTTVNGMNERGGNRSAYSSADYREAYLSVYREMLKNKIRHETKMKIYKGAIRSTVMYGAETMCTTSKQEEKFKKFKRKI